MGLQITITNYSSLTWAQTQWRCVTGTTNSLGYNDEITQTPSPTIQANDGQTTAAANQISLESITQDALNMTLSYSAGNDAFGIYITQHFQEFSIGTGDTWAYLKNGTWTNAGQDGTPITWTFADCTVVATPTLAHQSASVSVLITNPPSR